MSKQASAPAIAAAAGACCWHCWACAPENGAGLPSGASDAAAAQPPLPLHGDASALAAAGACTRSAAGAGQLPSSSPAMAPLKARNSDRSLSRYASSRASLADSIRQSGSGSRCAMVAVAAKAARGTRREGRRVSAGAGVSAMWGAAAPMLSTGEGRSVMGAVSVPEEAMDRDSGRANALWGVKQGGREEWVRVSAIGC